jgi:hypothetical protein
LQIGKQFSVRSASQLKYNTREIIQPKKKNSKLSKPMAQFTFTSCRRWNQNLAEEQRSKGSEKKTHETRGEN